MTGSSPVTNTIGTVVVAALAASDERVFPTLGPLPANQISNKSRQPMGLIFRRAVFDQDVLALDETCFLQALAEGCHEVRGVSERGVPQETNNRHRRLLGARRERPRGCRAP
jgi:hypothetical protein